MLYFVKRDKEQHACCVCHLTYFSTLFYKIKICIIFTLSVSVCRKCFSCQLSGMLGGHPHVTDTLSHTCLRASTPSKLLRAVTTKWTLCVPYMPNVPYGYDAIMEVPGHRSSNHTYAT